jgi:apolipoprotein N-acyltransferase
VDVYVVVIANLLLFLLALFGSYRHGRALENKNPNVFIRSVMGMTVLKFFVLVAAALIYVFTAKENRNVPAIIISLVLYILYAILEVSAAYKMNKNKSTAQ